MSDVVDLDSRRPPPLEPETWLVRIETVGPGDRNPKVTLERADGAPAIDIDPRELGSALLYAALSLGKSFQRLTGEQDAPVAGVMVYRSGVVRCIADCAEFVSPVRKRWLERAIARAPAAFAAVFDEAGRVPDADPGDHPGE